MSPRPDWQLKPHGTTAAYKRHYRRGEKPCEACRQAERRRQAGRDRKAEYAARTARYAIAREAGISPPVARYVARVPARLERALAGVS